MPAEADGGRGEEGGQPGREGDGLDTGPGRAGQGAEVDEAVDEAKDGR
jgi:hypothetical protein